MPKDFPDEDRDRITRRVLKHFRMQGKRIRAMTPPPCETEMIEFRPELFEHRARVSGLLDEAGFLPFSEYGSIDLLHAEYGLEVCGIQ